VEAQYDRHEQGHCEEHAAKGFGLAVGILRRVFPVASDISFCLAVITMQHVRRTRCVSRQPLYRRLEVLDGAPAKERGYRIPRLYAIAD
jgi:hypothetical protein